MLHKIRTLIQNNSNFVQALAAVVQTLIALCMLLTLIQNAMTLSVTSRQLESSIEPVLDLAMYGKNLKVTNSGLATIRKLEETSLIVGHYDITSQKISDYIAMIYRSPLCDEVGVGNSYVFDLSHYKQFMPSPTAPESLEVYLLVLQYRRAVDMKPFIKLVPFMSPKDSQSGEDLYMPLFHSPGSSSGGTSLNGNLANPWLSMRQELIKLYNTEFTPEEP